MYYFTTVTKTAGPGRSRAYKCILQIYTSRRFHALHCAVPQYLGLDTNVNCRGDTYAVMHWAFTQAYTFCITALYGISAVRTGYKPVMQVSCIVLHSMSKQLLLCFSAHSQMCRLLGQQAIQSGATSTVCVCLPDADIVIAIMFTAHAASIKLDTLQR